MGPATCPNHAPYVRKVRAANVPVPSYASSLTSVQRVCNTKRFVDNIAILVFAVLEDPVTGQCDAP